jgi:hypothetical protein
VPGPGDPDEPGQREQLVGVLPAQDLRQGVGAGDEVEVHLRAPLPVEVTQGVDRVCRPGTVDVDPAHREVRVRGGGDDRHEVAVLGGGDLALVLLPGLAGGHEDHLVEPEPGGRLASGYEVPVVHRVEGAAHDPQAPVVPLVGRGLAHVADPNGRGTRNP